MPRKSNAGQSIAVTFRAPSLIVEEIDKLVNAGYFKDRADFGYQAALDFLERYKARIEGRSVVLRSTDRLEKR